MKKNILILFTLIISFVSQAQNVSKTMLRLPDTGETTSYTTTPGEDADYNIFAPYFMVNGNGTVTDTVTGLMWQQTDGGEMTIENAITYCDTLTLGGYTDWRLPDAHEAFSILNHQYANPALNTTVFTTTAAEYWWTSERQANNTNVVWVTNAGGGVGNHPKTETISAGGTKRFHVRAVREIQAPVNIPSHFTDNTDGTITDNVTQLVWQKNPYADTLSWEDALKYADTLSLAGQSDWRLPNIKELQSINDESRINPSVNITFFPNIGVNKYWSSTTLPNQTTRAWYLHTQYGITTYNPKTYRINVLCVRGNPQIITSANEGSSFPEIKIYPNPAMSEIHISLRPPALLEITDICGKRMLKKTLEENSSVINISSFPKGIYLLKISCEEKFFEKKIVKI
jgi:hypothetical protein